MPLPLRQFEILVVSMLIYCYALSREASWSAVVLYRFSR